MEPLAEQANPRVIDLISMVKSLSKLNYEELYEVIKDSHLNNGLRFLTHSASPLQIEIEELAKIPIHLMATLIQSYQNEALFKYMLSGMSLLRTLYEIVPRHSRLEQILFDDIIVVNQLVDLISCMLIMLNNYAQENQPSLQIAVLHSTLVATSLRLLRGSLSSHWAELATLLVNYPKVDKVMETVFAAVRLDFELLQKLSGQCIKSNSSLLAEEPILHLCQQCEASLQFLHMLCQQKMVRERLVKHKVLCGKGGILLLARIILDLDMTSLHEIKNFAEAISRAKSNVLSILLHLCEVESISYLDEVASTPGSLGLAKSVALEVLELLKTLFNGYYKESASFSDKNIPKGLLQLNAMRLADIFSDDSNFRSYITIHITEVLTTLFSLPHGEFLSSWCASDLLVWEEDAILEYDPFVAARWVLNFFASSDILVSVRSESTFIPCNMPRASYAHQRTSLLVKVIANLHCFVPDICKEEKDLFLSNFFQCVRTRFRDLSGAVKGGVICRNLRSLLSHAESLTPSFLNEEDVQLLRVFITQLEPLISTPEFKTNQVQEAQNAGGYSSTLIRKAYPDHNNRAGNLKDGIWKTSALQEVDQLSVRGTVLDQADDEVKEYKTRDKSKPVKVATRGWREMDNDNQNLETSGSDSSSTRGKNSIDQINNVREDRKAEVIQQAENQRRKRKRTIMNDKQTCLIETALVDIPDMHRHASALQLWADRLSEHGSEVTSSQLKNWLNNRKAKLARAAKDVRGFSEGDNSDFCKQSESGIRPLSDPSECPVEHPHVQLAPQGDPQDEIEGSILLTVHNGNPRNVVVESADAPAEGQFVMLVNEQGEEVGKGKVYQAHGKWCGRNLEEGARTCVMDIIELKCERWTSLPHPCEATGTSFDQAEKKLGVTRVLWDSNKLRLL